MPLGELAKVLQSELHGTALSPTEEEDASASIAQESANLVQEILKAKDTLIEELRRERDYWRDLALKLQSQIEQLQHLALPAPNEKDSGFARRLFRWLRCLVY
ncbi:MAG: hypothetical protein QXD86_06535 [Candidatus Bathyarchaeia archaeon]